MKYPQLVSMPSAVSDWLEEQLEARGIDAVVYTRYVLSLLYRDPVDIICPDQDLHVTHPNKEVRRSGGSRKRIRRSSEWWGHTQADADQLKRSAAVECLMSASDQKCGIESLVDELCEKLKEVNDRTAASKTESSPIKINNAEVNQLSPQDLAKQYYAAFPPLSRNSSNASPTNFITLIPKWFSSPKKKPKKQNRSASYDEKLYAKNEADCLRNKPTTGKQKLNSSKKELGRCRNVAKSMKRSESMTDWNLYMFNNDNTKEKRASDIWPQKLGMMAVDSAAYINDVMKEANDESEECSWNDLDENLNMYDDLPVDIRELLDSPVPQDDPVKIMNLANMRDTGNKSFINSGTNIISSIWSNDSNAGYDTIYDNTYNTALDADDAETLLGVKFSAMALDNGSVWPSSEDIIAENERNLFFENCTKSTLFGNINLDNVGLSTWHVAPTMEKWSDAECAEDEMDMIQVGKSLSKLEHKKEASAFAEVYPRPRNPFTVFSKSTDSIQLTLKKEPIKRPDPEADKEDLLTSSRTHFRPISDKLDELSTGKYVDGTTFVIPSNLDKISYKRSESGSMFLDDEYGSPQTYCEFKGKVHAENSLVTKFKVIQNDKASQTDFEFPLLAQDVDAFECKTSTYKEDLLFPGDHELLSDETNKLNECTCSNSNDNLAMKPEFSFGSETVNCPVHLTRPDSVTAEIFGNYETKCDKCSKNIASWNTDWVKTFNVERTYDRQSEKEIWNGEICVACLRLNEKRPPLSQEQDQFRQDIKRDGDQLLSDISSCLQKSYMEEAPAADAPAELNDLLAAKEIKRRHSTAANYYGCIFLLDDNFSFASRLEQDCMNKLTSVIPTLRSVTL